MKAQSSTWIGGGIKLCPIVCIFTKFRRLLVIHNEFTILLEVYPEIPYGQDSHLFYYFTFVLVLTRLPSKSNSIKFVVLFEESGFCRPFFYPLRNKILKSDSYSSFSSHIVSSHQINFHELVSISGKKTSAFTSVCTLVI